MHGMVLMELQKFVETNHGPAAWKALLKDAGLESKIHMATAVYPDEEVVALVTAASAKLGQSAGTILEAFGRFLVPDLLKMFHAIIRPEWKTLDVLMNTENSIHRAVRVQNPGATPPRLQCRRESGNEVVILYDSPRKLCDLAKGLVEGIAQHYKETVSIREKTCMHKGDAQCQIAVRKE